MRRLVGAAITVTSIVLVGSSLIPSGAMATTWPAKPRTLAPTGDTTPHQDARSANPGAPGPYETRTISVFRGWEAVDVGLPVPVEDLAEITLPTNDRGGAAAGRFPVVLLLHGRHAWCSDAGDPVPEPGPGWCPSPYIPVASYTGYRYVAERLASQGRIVVSISANGINAQDNEIADLGADARAQLVKHHLTSLAGASRRSTPGYGGLLVGHVDLARTVLMGHSRGGEGVVRAAQVLANRAEGPIGIAGVIPLAPVSYLGMAPPVVPTVTLLPACDGDQEEQPGQMYQDRGRDLYGGRGALRSSIWIPGGNHNYFNTQWTPGLSVSDTGSDDADYVFARATGSCEASRRLTPAEERTIGLQYVAAAVRYAQDGDETWLPLLDGTGRQVPAVQRLGRTVRTTSLAGPDRLLLIPSRQTKVRTQSLTAAPCRGDSVETPPDALPVCGTGVAETGQDTAWITPRWVRYAPLPGRTAVELAWSRSGSALISLGRTVDLSDADRLSARVVLDPASIGTVGLAVQDASGNVATLPTAGRSTTHLTSGMTELRLWPQTVWVAPDRFRGVDLTRIVAVGASTQGQGRGWLLDVSRRTASPSPNASVLPAASVDVSPVTIAAGTSADVPVTVSLDRVSDRPARFVIQVGGSLDPAVIPGLTRRVTIPAGSRDVTVPVPVTMPAGAGASAAASVPVAIYPTFGATLDRQRDVLSVTPPDVSLPRVSLPSPVAIGTPGTVLNWNFIADVPGQVVVAMRVQSSSMDYSDLDPAFLAEHRLPTSGPIPSNVDLTLVTTQVGTDTYRATLPLSGSARPGAGLGFFLESIQGGVADDLYSIFGGVE